ncbi:Siderophore synthetase component [Streptomyces sp. LaPpAH-199]|uniref:IucA/IucC family protein n=1 Tax=Streptomyces TaxID=1883 RepID=UPI0008881753|nr:IucA/IucC family siderophore biosynthesis protein [Streptomyces sp. LaPpAH-199]MYW79242.1 IucA/IucC family siderophore biosynthesis protein [Streptomyces sp. SID8369]SDE30294.1 Siderophore synthetase component [Streptomyces sp. LaPpAH-199]
MSTGTTDHPAIRDTVAHLRPDAWGAANRALVRKALAEFAHEKLLCPTPEGEGRYTVRSDDGTVAYRFAARRMALDHWQIDPHSITRHQGKAELALDAADLILELRGSLGLSDEVLPVYLEEINSTLSSAAYKLSRAHVSAAALSRAGFQAVESGMTEGHPGFVANNGRIGFDIEEFHQYAPEAASPVRLIWLAAPRDRTVFTSCSDIDYDSLIEQELGGAQRGRFEAVLTDLGLNPADYFFFPVHPWQWTNRISITFAGEVATRRLVPLGQGEDAYLPQQSIRTFFNTDRSERRYVKTAISVLNMGFMRGLSAAYMEATPAINDWLADLIAGDPVLRGTGLTILREQAAIGYRHPQYEAATDRFSPYRKMLAALWRESPIPALAPGERLATMASLLHTDREGKSLAVSLIAASPLPPEVWLRRYLDAYLTPLLHSFYAHDLAFMPHGENVILVLDEDGTVVRAVFKDIAEEIVIMDPEADLPETVRRIRAEIPDEMRLLSIFTDVFDNFLRYLSALLDEARTLGEDDFWRTVAECVHDYRKAVPHLAERFERFDIFAAAFPRSCLNRLQLRNNRQMVDLADPSAALHLIGELDNPLAPYA